MPFARRCGRKTWIYPTVFVCIYGFFKEFKPSEPFLNQFLIHPLATANNSEDPGKGFSNAEVEAKVYPMWTYSYLVAGIFTLILSDIVVYKPVIMLESWAYLATRILLIWGTSILSMRMMQITYGIASATEVAYYSYIYVMIDKEHYRIATSFLRATVLFGRSVSGYLGQILYSTGALDLLGLHYFSLGPVAIACVIAIFLPNPAKSLFPCSGPAHVHVNCKRNLWKHLKQSLSDLKQFYLNLHLLKWSIWWAVATCGMLQVGNYVESLWSDIQADANELYPLQHKKQKMYNGLVIASDTLVASAAALLVSLLRVNWSLWGEGVLGVISVIDCALLFIASSTYDLWVAYVCQICFRGSYALLITIATVEISQQVRHQSYSLILGINMTAALLLETILTAIVSDNAGLALSSRSQVCVLTMCCFTNCMSGKQVYL
jgi:thiamine transporter 2/3